MIIRAEKTASLLFALFFAYFLKSTILGYATEPKVIGGIDFDQPIPQVIPWTPIYFPLVLSAAFGYWVWPTKSYQSLARKMAAGSFAVIRVTFVTLFISLLCAGFGEFYLAFPRILTIEVVPMLVNVFLSALGTAVFFGLFHGIAFVAFGVFFGCLIVLVAHGVASTAPSVARAGLDSASPSRLLSSPSQWPWLSLLAGLVATAIALAGLGAGGPFIIVMWALFLLPWGILWLAVGAAIGSVSEHWAWCVAVSLPIGYLSSMMHATPPGVLASQSIDFPPILFAMLLGFALARKLLRRHSPQTAAG